MVSAPAATPGGERREAGRRPPYVVEIHVSPQLRERDPDRPLSLWEALNVGRPQHPEPAATPTAGPSQEAGATWAGHQLRRRIQRTHAQHASDLISQAEHQLTPDSDRHPQATPASGEHVSATASAAGSRQAEHAVPAREHPDQAGLPAVPAEPASPPFTSTAHPARAGTRATGWQAEAG